MVSALTKKKKDIFFLKIRTVLYMKGEPPAKVNVLCVSVRDVLQANDATHLEPEKDVKPRSRGFRKVLTSNGEGYITAEHASSIPYISPFSPANGAHLEAILGNPGEAAMGILPAPPKKEKETTVSRLPQVGKEAPFKVVPPPPKDYQKGHWLDLSARRTGSPSVPNYVIQNFFLGTDRDSGMAESKANDQGVLQYSPPSGEVALAEEVGRMREDEGAANLAVNQDVREGKMEPDLPLSNVSKQILENTLDAFKQYKPAALEAKGSGREGMSSSEAALVLAQLSDDFRKRSTPRPGSSPGLPETPFPVAPSAARASVPFLDLDEDEVKAHPRRFRPSTIRFSQQRVDTGPAGKMPLGFPKPKGSTLNMKTEQRIPFEKLVNQTFSFELRQIAAEKKRLHEINIVQSSMRFSKPRFRKAKRNIELYGLSNTPEKYPHYLPGPFKRNITMTENATRRPKKK